MTEPRFRRMTCDRCGRNTPLPDLRAVDQYTAWACQSCAPEESA